MPTALSSHAELIADSAAHAAWAGAAASSLASMVALGVAVWGARRDAVRRRRQARDEAQAFAFGMVGALEMIKPLVIEARADPDGALAPRRYGAAVDHARMIADAALAIRVFDMQMLRDGYLLRGLLNGLEALGAETPGAPVPCAAVLEFVEPVLDAVLEADDRFFAHIPALAQVQGIGGRTPLARPPQAGAKSGRWSPEQAGDAL